MNKSETLSLQAACAEYQNLTAEDPPSLEKQAGDSLMRAVESVLRSAETGEWIHTVGYVGPERRSRDSWRRDVFALTAAIERNLERRDLTEAHVSERLAEFARQIVDLEAQVRQLQTEARRDHEKAGGQDDQEEDREKRLKQLGRAFDELRAREGIFQKDGDGCELTVRIERLAEFARQIVDLEAQVRQLQTEARRDHEKAGGQDDQEEDREKRLKQLGRAFDELRAREGIFQKDGDGCELTVRIDGQGIRVVGAIPRAN